MTPQERKEHNLKVALDLAAAGWPVFALSGGKVPFAGSHGHLDASTDPEVVRKAMARPGAVPAIALTDGRVVIDIDPRNGGTCDSVALSESDADVRTPGGGWHFYHEADGLRLRNGVLPGVDLKAKGGYVVAPGAILPGGKAYEGQARPKPMPAGTRKILDEAVAKRAERAASDEPEELGTRDEILHLAGRMRRAGLDAADIEAALLARLSDGRIVSLDESRPWRSSDLRGIAKDIGSKAAPNAADVPSPEQEEFTRSTLAWLERWKAKRRPKDGPGRNLGIDAVDLLAMNIPPLVWVVDGLISAGTTILAAEPKIGKSWLAYQACVEVAVGGTLLSREVMKGSALYYALEDGERRGQDRLRKTLKGRSFGRGALEVRFGAPRIGKGLEEELNAWLDSTPDARLVVIDTLQKVRPPQSGRRGSYEVDVEDLGAIQDVFRDRPVALLVVHHTRKLQSDDFLATVSGTYGITGSADAIITLKRKRLEADGKLDMTNRDGPEGEIAVMFDGTGWSASSKPVGASGLDSEVWNWLREHGRAAFASEIATAIDRDRLSVQRVLGEMHEAGALSKGAGGYTPRAPARRRAPGA